ncbi:MAG: NADH-quinone oxidoreductase subunit E [bacterium]|nr:NADH-quinone oxidoreductase subunit E [bacterium]
MDLRLMDATATADEIAAVDVVLGPPESGWTGGVMTAADTRLAQGGYHAAAAQRHLLLPALLQVQSEIGWISEGAMNYVCVRLQVPPAEAHGVATFYALLSTTKRPDRVAHVCDDVGCRDRGGGAILEAFGDRDDVVPSPCLGQCDRAPAVFVQRAGESDVVLGNSEPMEVELVLGGGSAPPPPVTAPQVGDGSLRLLRRVGVVDPAGLDSYRSHGGYEALIQAIGMSPGEVIAEVKVSNIRGRGGAAFPMGIKWEGVAAAPESERYLICNADESEPGTFKDRVLMEGDPFALVESMTIAGYAVGATKGYIYVRSEYPVARQRLEGAIAAARDAGLLGSDVAGSGFAFDLEVRSGAGAYICGEETALMNSIEGYRGEPRNKPPFPTQVGLFGKPTVINNVETLMNVPDIIADGGAAFAALGTEQSTGTKLFCLAGDIAAPGVYEVPFGVTLGDVIELAGGVTGSGVLKAVLLGGAAGVFVGTEHLDMPLTLEDARSRNATLGSGVVMVYDDTTDFRAILRRVAEFFRDESCGQCVPCRVGTVRQEELLARHLGGESLDADLLAELAQVMGDASICGLGHTASGAIQSALQLGLVGD